VDDPTGQHTEQLPRLISREELAAIAPSAYLLRTVPDGFELRIIDLLPSTAPSRRSADQPAVYMVAYTNQAGEYLRLRAGKEPPKSLLQQADEVYTTASGVTASFQPKTEPPISTDEVYAIVQAPDGRLFELASSLSRERVKALVEDLAPIG
jgi:hypothetical protein